MTWKYVQRSGHLYDTNKRLVGTGYSGDGPGLNNPLMQDVPRVGPIPVGRYIIGPPKDPIDHLGPIALPLVPIAGNVLFGRSGFFMHGDNASMDHTASLGCIVALKSVRILVRDSYVRELDVVAKEADLQ
jgi:hypothetical protein